MRILVLTNFYPPQFIGGYELQCQVYAEGLREKGHEVRVLTSRHGASGIYEHVHRLLYYINPADDELNYPSWIPRRLSRPYIHLQRALNARRNYRITRQTALEFKPDLVFVWNMSAVEATPVLSAQRLQLPMVFNLGDYWLAKLRRQLGPEFSLPLRLYRTYYRGIANFDELDVSYLQIISETLKQHYVNAGFSPDSLTVIPRGIDPQYIIDEADLPSDFHERGDKTIRMMYAGRLDTDKGVHIAIEALGRLSDYPWNITLDIMGDGEQAYMEHLQDLIQMYGLEKRVNFLGHQPREKVLAAYKKVDLALLPSIWVEPFGNVVLEALAHGVPMIATDQGGPSETITHRENGLLVPPNDAAAMADAIQMLVSEPDLMANIRRKGLQIVREKYNSRLLLNKIEEYLLNVLDKHRIERKA
jgi:glycosyltransferase involved in cell wall biosynthesis